MADALEILRKKKYRDYAYILTMIERDETGSLRGWANKVAKQLKDDESDGYANTKAWILKTLPRTKWGLARTARQEAGEIIFARGQQPDLEEDYKANIEDRRVFIRETAARIGAQMSDEEINSLALESQLEGYDNAAVQRMVRGFITQNVLAGADLMGTAGDFQNELNDWAAANGIGLGADASARYIQQMVNSERSLDDVKQELRETYLVGAFPAWAEKIRNGYDPSVLAAPYVSTAERLLEVGEGTLGFDDPIVKAGMQSTDSNGQPRVLPLYEYERMVRDDPRWEYTNNAYATYTKVGTDLLRMFGFR